MYGSGGHSKCNCIQDWAKFNKSLAWQILLIFNTDIQLHYIIITFVFMAQQCQEIISVNIHRSRIWGIAIVLISYTIDGVDGIIQDSKWEHVALCQNSSVNWWIGYVSYIFDASNELNPYCAKIIFGYRKDVFIFLFHLNIPGSANRRDQIWCQKLLLSLKQQ